MAGMLIQISEKDKEYLKQVASRQRESLSSYVRKAAFEKSGLLEE